jgi:hypothetical protein
VSRPEIARQLAAVLLLVIFHAAAFFCCGAARTMGGRTDIWRYAWWHISIEETPFKAHLLLFVLPRSCSRERRLSVARELWLSRRRVA